MLFLFALFSLLLPTRTSDSVSIPGESSAASSIEIHTTGPNCWVTGTPQLVLSSWFPGFSTLTSVPTLDQVRNHVGVPVFMNMTEIHFSCIDGRYAGPVVGTVGGDAAEFILALNVARLKGVFLDGYVVEGLFRSYVERMEPLRKFYMHTDEHAFENILVELELELPFDIAQTPDYLKGKVLNLLKNATNIGCGHLKNMKLYPTEYNTPGYIIDYFFDAFFNYMWLEDFSRDALNKKLLYVTLQGSHSEQGVLEIDNDGCPGMAAAIPSASNAGSFFVHHTQATDFLRLSMSTFFVASLPSYFTLPSFDILDFQSSMNALGASQLNLTASKLAAGLPLITVSVEGNVLTLLDSVLGMLIVSIASWIVVIFIAAAIYTRKVDNAEIIAISGVVQVRFFFNLLTKIAWCQRFYCATFFFSLPFHFGTWICFSSWICISCHALHLGCNCYIWYSFFINYFVFSLFCLCYIVCLCYFSYPSCVCHFKKCGRRRSNFRAIWCNREHCNKHSAFVRFSNHLLHYSRIAGSANCFRIWQHHRVIDGARGWHYFFQGCSNCIS